MIYTTRVTTTDDSANYHKKKWDEYKILYLLLAIALIASMVLNICLILVR